MKTGMVIVGNMGIFDKNFDIIGTVKHLTIKTDRIEVVAPIIGHFDIMDVW